MLPSFGVNLMALPRRFINTCLNLTESARTTKPGWEFFDKDCDFLSARGRMTLRTSPKMDSTRRLFVGQFHAAGFDLGQIQNVTDEAEEMLAAGVNVLDVATLAIVKRAVGCVGKQSEKPRTALSGVRSS